MNAKEYKALEKASELRKKQNYEVIKANMFIQKTRFSLTLVEQRIILYLISKVMPEDDDFKLYEFDINEFCRVCGIAEFNGFHYIELKKALKNLADKSRWVLLDDGRETIIRWIDRPYIEPKSGIVQVKLDELLKPYLLQLKENFTKYSLFYVLAMKSQYSVRLYELLKSYEFKRHIEMDIEELKRRLDAEKYTLYGDFKRRVLDVAIKEINALSDIVVNYESAKTGKKYTDILFMVSKKDVSYITKSHDEINKRTAPKNYQKGQISMFEPEIDVKS